MRRQLSVEVWIFFYLAILQSGVVEAGCQQTCAICSGSKCTACNESYFLSNNWCHSCHSRCTACFGSKHRQCFNCTTGHYLYGTSCYKCYNGCTACTYISNYQCSVCVIGSYPQGATCNPCRQICTACTGLDVCTTCVSGYYKISSMCYQCPSHCRTCTSSTWCTSCMDGYDLSGGSCNQCQSPCKTCTSSTWCTSCTDGYYYSGGSCHQCQPPCKTCTSSSYCTSCTDGYYYSGSSCHQCHPPCKTCTDTTFCTTCEDSYYLGGAVCNECETVCTKCSSSSQCTECVTGRYGRKCTGTCTKCKNVCDINGACTQGCKDGTYGTYCNNACSESCVSCSSWTACAICAQGTYRTHSYQHGYHCISCPDNCAACTSATSCQICSGNNFNADIYTECECDASKCAAISSNLCSACNDMTWYPSHSGCCPCSQTCEEQQCGSDGVCSQGCIDGYYGDLCEHTCDGRCVSNLCERNGECSSGCQDGYYGNTCQLLCSYRQAVCVKCSGSDQTDFVCTKCTPWQFPNDGTCMSCNNGCKYNSGQPTCDASHGTCINGCNNGWYGRRCDSQCQIDNCHTCGDDTGEAICSVCSNGFYKESNTNCSSCSPHCYHNRDCNIINGSCTEGCAIGWHGDRCDVECSTGCAVCNQSNGVCTLCISGKHGEICEKECSDGCKTRNNATTCAKKDGQCTYGCLQGRWIDTCENLCNEGCLHTNCNKSNGNCLDGCSRDYFGHSCESQCSNNCLEVKGLTDTNVCQREGGVCIGGCNPGYYGDTCVQACGNCQNTTCHPGNGTCTHGCVTGYIGSTCIQDAAAGVVGNGGVDGATVGGAVGGAVGGTIGVIIIVIVVVVIVLIMRKRRGHGKSTDENKRMKEEPGPVYYNVAANGEGQENGMQYGKHSPDPEKPIPAVKIQALSAPMANPPKSLPIRPSKKDAPSQQQQQQPQPDVVQSASREHKSDNLRASVNSLLEPLDEGGPVPVCKFEEGDTYYNTAAMMKSRIPVNDLAAFVTKKTNSDYVTEFKKLPSGLTRPYRDAQQPQNVTKNRYNNIYPYDDTRVFLTDGGPDYINASYIQGHKSQRDYIAALGPITTTIDDFWRMVWQEGSQVIVMLTRLVEAAHTKCQQYWPNRGTADNYGDMRVACHTEDSYAEFAVRSFSVTKGLETRKLHHVHFTAWPDKGVPDDVTGLIEFRQKVNNLQTRLDVPLIVHCSAGIGRTGTFIALDTLTRSGEDEGTVDIFGCVIAMRGQRVNLVQTDEQYEYLHHAVVHSLTFGCRSIPAEEMSQRYAELLSEQLGGLTQLDTRFEQLQSVGEAMSKETESSVHTNRSFAGKNRTGSDIPGDIYRPRLFMNRTPGASNYINAVRLNGFKTKDMFIAAQTPLPTTIVDFLTMIVQEKCTCIVSMDADESLTALEKNYWPLVNGTMKHGIFTVTCPEMTSTMYSIRRKLVISTHVKKTNEDHVMWQTTYTGWPSSDVIPRDPETLLRMIQDIDRLGADSDSNGPVIVYCMDGAERCGLYCAVSVLVEKMQVDHEVSLVNTLRQVKSRRRSAIPNKEQYQFCYQAIVAYLESFSTYSNFSLTQVNLTPHDSGPDSMVTTA